MRADISLRSQNTSVVLVSKSRMKLGEGTSFENLFDLSTSSQLLWHYPRQATIISHLCY